MVRRSVKTSWLQLLSRGSLSLNRFRRHHCELGLAIVSLPSCGSWAVFGDIFSASNCSARSRRSRPPGDLGHRVPHKGPAHPPYTPQTRLLDLGFLRLLQMPWLETLLGHPSEQVPSWDSGVRQHQLHQLAPPKSCRVEWSWPAESLDAASEDHQLRFPPLRPVWSDSPEP